MHVRLRLGGLPQQGLQIRAVDAHMRCAIALCCAAQCSLAHDATVSGVVGTQVLWKKRHGVEPVLQSPRAQDAGDIGAQLHPSTFGGQVRAALKHINAHARTRQGQRRRQASNASTGNQQRGIHGVPLSAMQEFRSFIPADASTQPSPSPMQAL